MASNPAVLFYTADYLVGTMLMTYEQKGKYMELLCLQHQHGPLTEEKMLSICGGHDEKVFSKFVQNEEGLYYNPRMEAERIKRINYSASRSNNRINGVKAKKEAEEHMKNICKSYENHMDNDNNITISTNNKQLMNVARTRESVENSNVENFGYNVENSSQRRIPENFDEDVVEFFAHEGLHGDPRDFIAYNTGRGWLGAGGEDLLQNNVWQRYAYKYSEDVENKRLWRYMGKIPELLDKKKTRR